MAAAACSWPTRSDRALRPSGGLPLFHGHIKFAGPILHDRIQSLLHVLLEIGRSAMGIERGLVFVLFVEKEFTRVLRGLVADIQQAARLPARILLKNTDVLLALFFRAWFHQHVNLQNDHLSSRQAAFFKI